MNMPPAEAGAIHIGQRVTTVRVGTAGNVVIAVGADELAEAVFRHDPPSALEIEHAIDRIEDALTASGLRHGERGDALIDDPPLHAMLGWQDGPGRAGREDVERLFQDLAAALPTKPAFLRDVPAGRVAAARLLILRECLHHLGFQGVRSIVPPAR